MLTGRNTMYRLTMRTGLLGLLALATACGDEDKDPDQPGEESAKDQLIAALGGQDALDALEGLHIEGNGSRFMNNEGPTPDEAAGDANTCERLLAAATQDAAQPADTARRMD